jgi:hypothetical protein
MLQTTIKQKGRFREFGILQIRQGKIKTTSFKEINVSSFSLVSVQKNHNKEVLHIERIKIFYENEITNLPKCFVRTEICFQVRIVLLLLLLLLL